jgi:hypothetical protein
MKIVSLATLDPPGLCRRYAAGTAIFILHQEMNVKGFIRVLYILGF